MSDKPDFLVSGEKSRLFPVLAETSKEGRTLSVVLSSMAYVSEFGEALLSSVGQRVGVRTKIDAYTEVVLKGNAGKTVGGRPDALIVLHVGKRRWTALIEAKIGTSKLDPGQIEKYLLIAKENNVDAVITISNEFTAKPDHHPTTQHRATSRGPMLYHWSWMFILTQATLLLSSEIVADRDQIRILSELVRFLTHPSTGVRGFERMPSEWSEIVGIVRGGGEIRKSSALAEIVIRAWHQEVRDLCLIMSRLIETHVDIRLPRAQRANAKDRVKADIQLLVEKKRMRCEIEVPATANQIVVESDLLTRSILVSMRLAAPADRKSSSARINWLIRQLSKTASSEVFVRAIWPGKAPATQASLEQLRADPDALVQGNRKMALSSFEVLLIRECGAKFSGARTFIDILEDSVPDFYRHVGQYLKAWQPPAPRLGLKTAPDQVSRAAIQKEYEQVEPELQTHDSLGQAVEMPVSSELTTRL